ncbi:MFS transporter [Paenibacillus cremeus]|uniref:MFS transporter n=1 Tax=Paenibacillus cremeus TaxID=2163881 RepID=A0A559K4N9_9BACL|nr:MFS transporter [Paenibacillus cremeus]TVY07094.1 MFS transporter [Paenibacillus cremeus]
MKAEYKVLRSNIRNNLWNGIAWSIGFNFVTPFIGVLAAQLGATNTDYALLSSIPALLTILITLPVSMVIERFRKQKRIIAGLILLCRFFYFLLVFVPLLDVSAMTALILLVGMYNATNSVIAVAWQSMMGELIPISYRNRVFSQRNIWTGLVGMVIAFVAGWGIDRFPYPLGYQVAFTIGFAAAIVETWYFMKLRIPSEEQAAAEVAAAAETGPSVRSGLTTRSFAQAFKLQAGRPYYLFCASAIIYIFTWQAAWPIYTKVKVDMLHATNTMMSIDTIVGAIGTLIGFRVWARFADRKGTGLTVFWSALTLAVTPYCWVYAPDMNWIYVYDLIGGVATAGFQQSVFNRLLELVPDQGRQQGIAIYTTLSQVSAIFAPIIGMQLFASIHYDVCMSILGSARVVGSLTFLIIVSPMVLRWIQRQKVQKETIS